MIKKCSVHYTSRALDDLEKKLRTVWRNGPSKMSEITIVVYTLSTDTNLLAYTSTNMKDRKLVIDDYWISKLGLIPFAEIKIPLKRKLTLVA